MLNSILSDRDTLLDKGFTAGFQVDLHKIGDTKIDSKVHIEVGDGYNNNYNLKTKCVGD